MKSSTSLNDNDCHSASQLYETVKTSVVMFLQNWQLIVMTFSMLLRHVGALRLMKSCFRRVDFQGRELCVDEFIKNTFNVGLHFDAYDLIYFRCVYDDRCQVTLQLYCIIQVLIKLDHHLRSQR